MKFWKLDPNIWLILAFSIFAWAPLLTPAYFFNAHDAKHSIFFLVEFDQTFRDGYLWPRWSPDFSFGYGYPLFNLYAPLAFYSAELLHLLGLSFTNAIKTMYILATIGAGLSMYGFSQRLFGRDAGLLAAIVYLYAPFHLVEIFVRSAYAEFVALALIPLLFWAFAQLIAQPTLRQMAISALIYGLLTLTHHTTFFVFTPLLMLYILYLIIVKLRLNLQKLITHTLYAVGAGVLGLSLAAIYLVPVVTETQFIKVDQWTSGSYSYLQHFVYVSQLFSAEWGYGYAGIGLFDDFSYQLGILSLTLLAFVLIALVQHRFRHYGTVLFFLGATFVILFLILPVAEPIWRLAGFATWAQLIQFPWRLLGMTTFTIAIVTGALLAQTVPRDQSDHSNIQVSTSPALYVFALVIILASFSYTTPQYTDIPAWAETPLAVLNWDRGSIKDRVGMVSVTEEQPQTSPLVVEYETYGRPLTVATLLTGQGEIETLHHGGSSDKVRVQLSEPATVQFYTYDYPGWRVTLNDQPVAHRHEPPFGLITIDVPAGEHIIHLQMGTTPSRTIGTILSGLSLLIAISMMIKPSKPVIEKT
ncbi:MAG: 6-pyruvoyl-tetrahydropterin synthase-related protein [Chloroflexota bacterium]